MRIMIAEDETIIRLDLRSLLEANGFQVCAEARDGIEAIELARSEEPDLAILDVKMPRLDGIEAARRISAESPIPIVMLTAFSQRRFVAEAVEAGVFAYLVKPFREEDLLPAIQTAAARHEELLRARRTVGKTPPFRGSLDVVQPSSAGAEWPLRIARTAGGGLEISLVQEQEDERVG